MSQHVHDVLQRVHDRASFVEFVFALGDDFADEKEKERESPSPPFGPGANGWENGTIDAFLFAAAQWAADYDAVGSSEWPNPWQFCAQVLYMGKIYE